MANSRIWSIPTRLVGISAHSGHHFKYAFVRKFPNQCKNKTVINLTKWDANKGYLTLSELTFVTVTVLDNGPQYSSKNFGESAKEFIFNHNTSSPLYSKSNRFKESSEICERGPYLRVISSLESFKNFVFSHLMYLYKDLFWYYFTWTWTMIKTCPCHC